MEPYVQYMYSYPHKTAYRPLKDVSFKNYAHHLSEGGHGLYLHVPFCQAKCGYCNLFSVTGQGEKEADKYLDAVERQCRQYAEVLKPLNTEFSQLVIGGGTPLLLTKEQLERMLALVDKYFRFCKEREVVVETAPNQTTEEKLEILQRAGVTRVSLGVQSFSERELAALRRQHGPDRARDALKLIKSFGFPCVNLDLIYGIPGQTIKSLLTSLEEALSYEPDEIFLYPLYVKHGAGLLREGIVTDGKHALLQYQSASRMLWEKGFWQDSMRRFVRRQGQRKFSECGFGSSLALGCGGRSYLGNLHFCTPYGITQRECFYRLEEYENTEDFTNITHGILLSGEEMKRRYVIRHLLIYPGLCVERYQKHFGSDATDDFPLLKEWMEKGFVHMQRDGDPEQIKAADEESRRKGLEEYMALTPRGLELSDYLGPQLISPKVQKAMEEWEVCHERAYDFVQGQSEKL